nr:MAG TPA: hypothetical protein [Caudoviricetes sp.]
MKSEFRKFKLRRVANGYCFSKLSIPYATQIFKAFAEKMFTHLINQGGGTNEWKN